MTEREKIQAVVRILKSKFPNLNAEEVINLAYDILEVVGE
jgi:hypothetical protein